MPDKPTFISAGFRGDPWNGADNAKNAKKVSAADTAAFGEEPAADLRLPLNQNPITMVVRALPSEKVGEACKLWFYQEFIILAGTTSAKLVIEELESVLEKLRSEQCELTPIKFTIPLSPILDDYYKRGPQTYGVTEFERPTPSIKKKRRKS
jgi:hypothetical protein